MQLTYTEIWNGIEKLAESKDLSLSGLAIKAGLDLGHGRGPLDHGYDITTEFKN